MFTTNLPYEEKESVWPEWHNPFPQPQTIPSGWDMSEVLSEFSAEPMTDPAVTVHS